MASDCISVTLRMFDVSTSRTFQVASSAPLADVMDSYSAMHGLTAAHMYFQFDGQLVFPYQSPAHLGMEDGDIVDVIINSASGGTKRERSGSADLEQDREKRGIFAQEIMDN